MKDWGQKSVLVLNSNDPNSQPIRLVFYGADGQIVEILEIAKITPKYAKMIAEHVKEQSNG